MGNKSCILRNIYIPYFEISSTPCKSNSVCVHWCIWVIETTSDATTQESTNSSITTSSNLTPLKRSMTVSQFFSGMTATVLDCMFSNYQMLFSIYSLSSVGILLGVVPKEIVLYVSFAFAFNINTTPG